MFCGGSQKEVVNHDHAEMLILPLRPELVWVLLLFGAIHSCNEC